MYTLQKAKEEIDAVAKHATDIAVHTLAIADNFDAKLESFKKDITALIESKFNELSAKIMGDHHTGFETNALNDLGDKVSLLINAAAPPAVQAVTNGNHIETPASEHAQDAHGMGTDQAPHPQTDDHNPHGQTNDHSNDHNPPPQDNHQHW